MLSSLPNATFQRALIQQQQMGLSMPYAVAKSDQDNHEEGLQTPVSAVMDQINELLNADAVCWKCPVVISWYACVESLISCSRPIPCSNPSECKRGTTAPVSSMLQGILIHPYLIPNKLPALIWTKWISITRASLNPVLSCKNTLLCDWPHLNSWSSFFFTSLGEFRHALPSLFCCFSLLLFGLYR